MARMNVCKLMEMVNTFNVQYHFLNNWECRSNQSNTIWKDTISETYGMYTVFYNMALF